MTEKELAGKFTPPDDKLVAVRTVLCRILEDRIREINQELGEGARGTGANNLTNYRAGITWAAYKIRDLIDTQGKILLEDLEGVDWPPGGTGADRGRETREVFFGGGRHMGKTEAARRLSKTETTESGIPSPGERRWPMVAKIDADKLQELLDIVSGRRDDHDLAIRNVELLIGRGIDELGVEDSEVADYDADGILALLDGLDDEEDQG